MFIVKKLFDEGSSSPYMARLYSNLFELRDYALCHKYKKNDIDLERMDFDKQFKPILEAMDVCRESVRKIENLWKNHVLKVENGQIIIKSNNSIHVLENIDKPLKEYFNQILVNGVIALKGVQKITLMFDVDISFLYMKEKKFKVGISNLETLGEYELALFLGEMRQKCTENFINLRNSIEHEGWMLPEVKINLMNPNKISVVEPSVNGMPITKYCKIMTNRIISSIENVMVYTFQKNLEYPFVIYEIPLVNREKGLAHRFDVTISQTGIEPWNIVYCESDFI